MIERRARTNLACALALATGALAVVTPPALAVNWTIKGSLANTTGSTADNCPVGGGTGCVLLGPNKVAYDDASNVVLPTSPIPTGSTGSFSFQAEGSLEGADMYALYTLPDNSTYEIIAEDDWSEGGIDGDYVGCSETSAQGSPYVCSAQWNGTYSDATPAYQFELPGQATIASVGQRCTGQLGGSNPGTMTCTQAGQLGPTDPNNGMVLVFASLESAGTYISDVTNGNNCRMTGVGQQCALYTTGSGNDEIQLGALDTSSASAYGVELVGTAVGPSPPDTVPTWPPSGYSAAPPSLNALSVARSGRTITYRASRPATTVFTVDRARRGGGWDTVGRRSRQTSLTLEGARHAGRCRTTGLGATPGARCTWRRERTGQLAQRGHAGRNAVRFDGRVDGRPLPPGRYRLTARARAHGTTLLSRPVTTHFTVTRRAGRRSTRMSQGDLVTPPDTTRGEEDDGVEGR